jgi:hypothetical protein
MKRQEVDGDGHTFDKKADNFHRGTVDISTGNRGAFARVTLGAFIADSPAPATQINVSMSLTCIESLPEGQMPHRAQAPPASWIFPWRCLAVEQFGVGAQKDCIYRPFGRT